MKNHKFIRTLIIVLVILLAISGTALAGVVLYKAFLQPQGSPAEVPDNVITPDKEASNPVQPFRAVSLSYRRVGAMRDEPPATGVMAPAEGSLIDEAEGKGVTLRLYYGQDEDSEPFHVGNMFPGDSEAKAYRLEVSYEGSPTVYFHADIRSGYEKLAEVLKCRVSLDGEQLYDGLMRDMPQSIPYTLPESSGTTETLTYDITVYLETSVGNEYMDKELYADFRWWANDSGGLIPPPHTGESGYFYIWFWVAMCSLLLNIILLLILLRRRTDKADRQEVGAHER